MIKRTTPRRFPQRPHFAATINRQISYSTLRVMDDQGQSLGVMDKQAALALANQQKKDLVLITDKADPPVVKIIELSKYKYQLSQKKAAERKRSRAQDIKEIRLRPFVDENDLQTKIRKARDFLSKKHKVRLSMELRGRAITKQDLAHQILDRFTEEIADLAERASVIASSISSYEYPRKNLEKAWKRVIAHTFHVFALIGGGRVAVVDPQECADLHFFTGSFEFFNAVRLYGDDLAGSQFSFRCKAQFFKRIGLEGDGIFSFSFSKSIPTFPKAGIRDERTSLEILSMKVLNDF